MGQVDQKVMVGMEMAMGLRMVTVKVNWASIEVRMDITASDHLSLAQMAW